MKNIICLILIIAMCALLPACAAESGSYSSGEKEDSAGQLEAIRYRKTVAAGGAFAIAVRRDGTVVASGYNEEGAYDGVSSWTNIVEVAAGSTHCVGLKSDGTVVASGDNSHGQCEVAAWTDVVSVSAGKAQTVGLRRDGTLVSTKITDTGYAKVYACGQDQVEDIRDAVSVAVGEKHIAVLKKDGTVITLGDNYRKQCETGSWKNIVQIVAGKDFTMGLDKSGKVFTTPLSGAMEEDKAVIGVSEWKNVSMVFAGRFNTYAVCDNGTVIATESAGSVSPHHEDQVTAVENVCYIVDGHYFTLVLQKNGTVILVGNTILSDGEIDVTGWNDIRSPFAS